VDITAAPTLAARNITALHDMAALHCSALSLQVIALLLRLAMTNTAKAAALHDMVEAMRVTLLTCQFRQLLLLQLAMTNTAEAAALHDMVEAMRVTLLTFQFRQVLLL